MKRRNIVFLAFVGAMMTLGLIVSNGFLFIGLASLCGGHMLLHDHATEPHAHGAVTRRGGKEVEPVTGAT